MVNGDNLRGAGSRSCHCQSNARWNRTVFSLDFKILIISLSVTVCGRGFQVAGTKQCKAHFMKAVLENGSVSVGSAYCHKM